MFPKDEFQKFATKHMGLSSMHLEKYMHNSIPNITGFTPTVIEERSMNIVGMDVFPSDDGPDHFYGGSCE